MRALSPADRRFFDRVAAAAFANPFSDERDRIDRELVGTQDDDPELVARLVARVDERLERLGDGALPDVRRFAEADRDRLEHAVLFSLFHRFREPFERSIEAQEKSGATPVTLPFTRDLLRALVASGLSDARAVRVVELFFQMQRAYVFVARRLVGASVAMRRVREALWNAVFTRDIRRYEQHLWNRMEDWSTLVLGATGTGKEAAAAAIGRSGYLPFDPKQLRFASSFTETFVPLNLTELAAGVIESELFGHVKGAFTGATRAYGGALARSGAHGTVFLDEVGEIVPAVQVKLLRVLQERSFAPVGSRDTRRFEGRIVAATHQPLDRLRAEGAFRDDFYYRLSACVIEMPTLSARLAESPSELRVLLDTLVPRILGHVDAELTAEIERTLRREVDPGYAWPGNVRELEHAIRRVLVGGAIAARPRDGHASFLRSVDGGLLDAQRLLDGYCARLYAQHGTYEAVARITGLDRRTVRKHVVAWPAQPRAHR